MIRRAALLAGAALVCAGAVRAATPAQSIALGSPAPGLHLIATRQGVPNSITLGTNTSFQAKTGHVAATSFNKVSIAIANFYIAAANPAEQLPAGSKTSTLYVEYGGKCVQLTAKGQTSYTIPAGGFVVFSATLPFTIPAGATFWTHELGVMSGSAVPPYVTGAYNSAMGDRTHFSASALSDIQCGTPANDLTTVSVPPLAIMGPYNVPSVVAFGDSIFKGLEDVIDNDYHQGITDTNIIPSTIPTLNISSTSLKAFDFSGNPSFVASRVALLQMFGGGTFFSDLGTNDFHHGTGSDLTVSGVEGYVSYVHSLVPSRMFIVESNILDWPTSSGSPNMFTSFAGQTADTMHASQTSFNADLAALKFGRIQSVYDMVTPLQTGGLWNPTSRSPVSVSDGAMTASSAQLTSATANFTASDKNCGVVVAGSGAVISNGGANVLTFTNATTVTLNASATTTVSGATINFGLVFNDGVHPCHQGYLTLPALPLSQIRY